VIGSEPTTDPRRKSELAKRIAPVLREVSDRIIQAHYVTEVARRLQIDERLVLSSEISPPSKRLRPAEMAQTRRTMTNAEEHLFALLLRHPLILSPVVMSIPEQEIMDARHVEILRALQVVAPETTEAALDALSGETRLRAEQLLGLIGERPLSYSGQARREAEEALQRLRKERHDYRMRQLMADLSAAARENDQEALRHNMELMDQVRARYPEFYPEPSPYFRDVRDTAS
jgi:DNA primase